MRAICIRCRARDAASGSPAGLIYPVFANNLFLDVRPPKKHATVRLVIWQNATLHPRIHGSRGFAKTACNFCFANESLGFGFLNHKFCHFSCAAYGRDGYFVLKNVISWIWSERRERELKS